MQLTSAEVAANDRAAVLVNAVSEVLAGHADAFALPALKLAVVDEIPFLHALVEQYRCIASPGLYPSTNRPCASRFVLVAGTAVLRRMPFG